MTKEEYLEKCMSVSRVLEKIINGKSVSLEERLKACRDAIEIFIDRSKHKSKSIR